MPLLYTAATPDLHSELPSAVPGRQHRHLAAAEEGDMPNLVQLTPVTREDVARIAEWLEDSEVAALVDEVVAGGAGYDLPTASEPRFIVGG